MLAELRVTPVEFQGDFADLIARVVRVIASSSLQYRVHALGTSVEGDLDEILECDPWVCFCCDPKPIEHLQVRWE